MIAVILITKQKLVHWLLTEDLTAVSLVIKFSDFIENLSGKNSINLRISGLQCPKQKSSVC